MIVEISFYLVGNDFRHTYYTKQATPPDGDFAAWDATEASRIQPSRRFSGGMEVHLQNGDIIAYGGVPFRFLDIEGDDPLSR